ncbi:MAG: ABC transporter ATP-binding protein [Bacillota bacterium]
MAGPKILLKGIEQTFVSRNQGVIRALDQVDLEIGEKEFVCVLGPSGCGKSTLLNVIAGFLTPTAGTALVDGQPVRAPGPDRGVIFQEPNLFPWLTALENVTFGPRMRHVPASTYMPAAMEALRLVGLEGFEQHLPKKLSGGMRQRVALARVLVADPQVLLMDEPFGALDAQTRTIMQELLQTIWERDHKTVLFITHDIEEAIFLADRVVVMTARPGRIKREVKVSLPRPRTLDMITWPEFVELKRELLQLIREEAAAAVAQGF